MPQPPHLNLAVEKLLNKLEAYEVPGGPPSVVKAIMRDQNNRMYILWRLSGHLDLIHTGELLSRLQGQFWAKLRQREWAEKLALPQNYFDDVKWPWQWGPEPEQREELVSLPIEDQRTPIERMADATYGRTPAGVAPEVRSIMIAHAIITNPQGSPECLCGKRIMKWEDYNKHLRIQISKFLKGE